MSILTIGILIGAMGAIGGIINCVIADEFKMPMFDKEKRIWRPGWIGNVLVGAVAALVVWAMYGPLSSVDIANPEMPKALTLNLQQLFISVIIGIGGGNILTQLAKSQADRLVKQELLDVIAKAGNLPASPRESSSSKEK